MTEDEFMAAMGHVSDQAAHRSENTGRLVLGLARVFIGLPMTPKDEGYKQQQALLKELQQVEEEHGYNLAAYPTATRVMLIHMLRAVTEVSEDALTFIVVTLVNGKRGK
jgi:hypothetical protein